MQKYPGGSMDKAGPFEHILFIIGNKLLG